MNQDKVKEILESVMPSGQDFTVIFSGKQSKKVNGLYHPETREIVIHNRNFETDGAMLYTAFHEYAHHIQAVKTGKTGHNKQFWSTFHNILDAAMDSGVYVRPDYKESTEILILELKTKLKEHARLEAEIGKKIAKLNIECEQLGTRVDALIDRELKLKRSTVKRLVEASKNYELFDEADYANADMLATIAQVPKSRRREESEKLIESTNIYAPTVPIVLTDDDEVAVDEREYINLARKRDRLDRTIVRLTEQRVKIEHEMQHIQVHQDAGQVLTPVDGDE